MGSVSRQSSTFLSVRDGKFVEKVKEGTKKAKSRIVTKGKMVGKAIWEKFHDGWEGYITKVTVKDSDYGEQCGITIRDDDGAVTIQCDVSGPHFVKLALVCKNIDVRAPVTIKPWKLQRTDKKGNAIEGKFNHGWTFYQHEDKVEEAIDFKSLPEIEEIKKKGGKSDWDSYDRDQETKKIVEKWWKKNEGKVQDVKSKSKVDEDDDEEEDDEDEDEEPKKKKGKSKSKDEDEDEDSDDDEDEDDDDDDSDESDSDDDEEEEEEEDEEEEKPVKKDKKKKEEKKPDKKDKKKKKSSDDDDDDEIDF